MAEFYALMRRLFRRVAVKDRRRVREILAFTRQELGVRHTFLSVFIITFMVIKVWNGRDGNVFNSHIGLSGKIPN